MSTSQSSISGSSSLPPPPKADAADRLVVYSLWLTVAAALAVACGVLGLITTLVLPWAARTLALAWLPPALNEFATTVVTVPLFWLWLPLVPLSVGLYLREGAGAARNKESGGLFVMGLFFTWLTLFVLGSAVFLVTTLDRIPMWFSTWIVRYWWYLATLYVLVIIGLARMALWLFADESLRLAIAWYYGYDKVLRPYGVCANCGCILHPDGWCRVCEPPVVHARLMYRDGLLCELSFTRERPYVLLGRIGGQDIDVALPAEWSTVSRRHLELRYSYTDRVFYCRDLESTYGTMLAGHPVPTVGLGQEISDGQVLSLGQESLRFLEGPAPKDETTKQEQP